MCEQANGQKDKNSRIASGAVSSIFNMANFGWTFAYAKNVGGLPAGTLGNRLNTVFAPTSSNIMSSFMIGTSISGTELISGIISFYAGGGKYGTALEY